MAARSPAHPTAQRRRPAELRRQLLDAADRVVAEDGPSASAERIAQEAGVSRSVLYRHFISREELLTEAVVGAFDRFLIEFRAVCQRQTDDTRLTDWELEHAFMTGLVDHLRTHRELLASTLSDRSVLPAAHRQALARSMQATLDEIAGIAATEIVARGRAIALESVGVKLRLEIAMVAGLVANESWLLPTGVDAWSSSALIDHLTAFTLYGAQNPPDLPPGSPTRRSGPA